MQELRQSTAIIVKVGPAIDSTGSTPVTTLAITTADEAEILKNDTTGTLAIAGTLGAITSCDGWYNMTLASTDVDTLGPLTVVINDDSLVLPIFRDYMVVDPTYYDAKYSTGPVKATLAAATYTTVTSFHASVAAYSTFDPAADAVSLGSATYTTATSFHASVAAYSTFDPAATGVTLGAALYASINDFKATVVSLSSLIYTTLTNFHASVAAYSTFDPAASAVSLGAATYTTVTSFHASVAAYSTFDPAADAVSLGSAVYTAITDFRATVVSLGSLVYTTLTNFHASVAAYSTFDPAATGVSLTSLVYTTLTSFHASVTGYSTFDPAASEVSVSAATVDAILDEVVEGAVTLRQATRLVLSVLTGKVSGGSTTTITFRDIGDTKNRLVVTVDENGNRTAVGTRDGS